MEEKGGFFSICLIVEKRKRVRVKESKSICTHILCPPNSVENGEKTPLKKKCNHNF